MKASMTKLLSLAVALLATFQLSAKDYDVQDFGAVADGIALNTNTIQYAIDFIMKMAADAWSSTPAATSPVRST